MVIKKIFSLLILFVVLYSVFLPSPSIAQTAESRTYNLLTPIPEFCEGGISKCQYVPGNFGKYLNALLRLTIILAAILSVIVIVYGGFQYMTSESLGMKEEGRERIRNAVVGLILLSASFLILNTINPNILNFKLDIGVVPGPNPTTGLKPTTIAETKEENATQPIQQTRQEAGINTLSTNSLTARSTRIEEAQAQIRTKVGNLKKECEQTAGNRFISEQSNIDKQGDMHILTVVASCVKTNQ